MEKVGILGSAVVGQALAQGFKAHGYEVRIGSRTPAKLASFTESSGVPAGTLEAVGGLGRAPGPGGAGDWCGSGPEPCRRG